jgi:fatty acid desaturase
LTNLATTNLAVPLCSRFIFKGSLLGSFIFGVFGTYMGANIGHDGGHYAISSIPWVNDVCVWGIGLICNPIIWQHQHTYAHHSFTNQHDHDPDLHHFHILMRYSPLHEMFPWYKMQIHSLYILWSIGWTNFGTCYWNSWRFVFERSLHGAVEWTDRKRWFRTGLLLLHTFGYFFMCYMVPFWYHERGFVAFLAGVIHMSTAGFIFGILSQVGHITELALARDPIKARETRHEIAKVSWAAEQVEATNDFNPESNVSFLLGGLLGLQIEHHLFPSLNHRHLQMIQPTVEACCKEYNVVYKKYDSWAHAMSDTIKYVQTLSSDENQPLTTKKIN